MTSDLSPTATTEGIEALGRLVRIAMRDTGQSRHVADFLLAWHNTQENAGWDPTTLWAVDAAIALDILATLRMLRYVHRYPGDLGFQKEIHAIWKMWRLPAKAESR